MHLMWYGFLVVAISEHFGVVAFSGLTWQLPQGSTTTADPTKSGANSTTGAGGNPVGP